MLFWQERHFLFFFFRTSRTTQKPSRLHHLRRLPACIIMSARRLG